MLSDDATIIETPQIGPSDVLNVRYTRMKQEQHMIQPTEHRSDSTSCNTYERSNFGEEIFLLLNNNLNSNENDQNAAPEDQESRNVDISPSVSSTMKRPDIQLDLSDDRQHTLNTPPNLLSPDAPASMYSGSVKYKTSLRALSPDGNIVESEIVRNYEIPAEVLCEQTALVDETEHHGIWLDGLNGPTDDDQSRPSINLTTRLKVSRTADSGGFASSDISERNPRGSSTMPLGASALTPLEDYPQQNRIGGNSQKKANNDDVMVTPVPMTGMKLCQKLAAQRSRDKAQTETMVLNPEECKPLGSSSKITQSAKVEIDKLRNTLSSTCEDLEIIQQGIVNRDFSHCAQFRDHIQSIPAILKELIPKLDYSPYEKDLWRAHDGIVRVLESVSEQPALIIMSLVELGFYIFEIGNLLGENVLPSCFAPMVHAINTRVHRLSVGRVVRQIIYVPTFFDPLVATYYKERRLERIENFCACQIRLLDPSHPRAAFCPPDCRTLQVDFDPVRGKHVGLLDLLNRCMHPKHCYARIAATVLRRANGAEMELRGHELVELQYSEPRPRLLEVRADICSGPRETISSTGTRKSESNALSKSSLIG